MLIGIASLTAKVTDDRPVVHVPVAQKHRGVNWTEAFYQTFWNKPWVAGVYWWKWYPVDGVVTNRSAENPDFSPQGKPAQDVMKSWFERGPE